MPSPAFAYHIAQPLPQPPALPHVSPVERPSLPLPSSPPFPSPSPSQIPRMPQTRQTPAARPKFTLDDLTRHCNSYFECSSDSWSWENFVTHFATFASFKLDVVNYKWTGALRSIEASLTETAARRSKAQSLLDRHRIVSVIKLLPSSFLPLNVSSGVGIG